MTSDWQEKHIFVYLVNFAQLLRVTNFVGGAFEGRSTRLGRNL